MDKSNLKTPQCNKEWRSVCGAAQFSRPVLRRRQTFGKNAGKDTEVTNVYVCSSSLLMLQLPNNGVSNIKSVGSRYRRSGDEDDRNDGTKPPQGNCKSMELLFFPL